MTDYRDFQGYGQGTSDPRHADPYRARTGNSGLLIALAAIALLVIGVFVYAGGPAEDRQTAAQPGGPAALEENPAPAAPVKPAE